MKLREYMADFEWHLLLLAFGISLIGITFIWSATRESLYFTGKPVMQALFALICLPLLFLILRFGYISIGRYAFFFYFLLLGLLVLLQVFGGRGGQAARWFDLGFRLRLQPSEFMKVALILALARSLMYRTDWTRLRTLAVPFAMTLAPMALIAMQPDLGTALLFLPLLFGMLFVAGARPKHLLILIFLGLATVPAIYGSGLLKAYQKERITSFFQHIPTLESEARRFYLKGDREKARELEEKARKLKRESGYQQYFSQVSIGSGGLTGQRLAHGPMNHLNYLPASHTDFIFAVIGEEWGFLGCGALIFLFLLMVAIIFGIGRRTREPFGRYLCCGVGVLFGTQVFVNAAVAVGLLPIAGLTLPLVSYGGSSLLTSFIALGLVLDVGARRVRVFGKSD